MKRALFIIVAIAACISCTTGTDVDESTDTTDPNGAALGVAEQARLDRIALIAQRLVADVKATPEKPASALMADLLKITREAEAK